MGGYLKLLGVCAGLATLTACAANGGPLGSDIPANFGGLPADAPQRPSQPAPYPEVHALPPDRAAKTLTPDQQLKLEQDLAATRTRQQKLEDPNARRQSDAANAATAAVRDKARAAAGKKPASEQD